ncbi:MAG: hypothetical protein FWD64_01940 [Acidobacteriaceae bacterium]|nr:hypothetical protein [Acidobacteriaceae bacterium]
MTEVRDTKYPVDRSDAVNDGLNSSIGKSIYWGDLEYMQLPYFLIDGKYDLTQSTLVVYCALLYSYRQFAKIPIRKRGKFDLSLGAAAAITVSQKRLMELTGYTDKTIETATKELTQKDLIQVDRRRKTVSKGKRKEFDGSMTNRYFLVNPKTGRAFEGGMGFIRKSRILYFNIPVDMIKEMGMPWSLAKMTESSRSDARLYLTILYLANKSAYYSDRDSQSPLPRNTFIERISTLKKRSGIQDIRTFMPSLTRLESHGLIQLHEAEKAHVMITILDPTTGEPVLLSYENPERHPRNYRVEGKRNTSYRFLLNSLSNEDWIKILKTFLPENAETIPLANGDVYIRCPYPDHSDSLPSCSVKLGRCFHCFGCGKKGSFTDLLIYLCGGDAVLAYRRIGEAVGIPLTYCRPDREAIAIYKYRNEDGDLQKEVLRYPDDDDGNKVIVQRRPGRDGKYRYDVSKLGPLLYHAELLRDYRNLSIDMVVITEGEKDADTVTNLGLEPCSGNGPVIGVTSGGADTWNASLAGKLEYKRVVVMPDDDPAGERYRDAVVKSLEALGIEKRVVSFAGTGCKDVTAFVEKYGKQALIDRIGTDWVKVCTVAETCEGIGADGEVEY